ncbi:MAG: glycosyltransferase family 4 protein, partial [Chloroflexota bacterium]|nr:glycosyltransferase family 4 protein [Chloroflexota bacterium]
AGLDSQRFEQLVVTGTEGLGEASMLPLARERGVDPVIIPELGREIDPRGDAVALLQLYRLFRRWRPDIVETHTAKAGTLGRLAALLAGVPVRVHVFHGHVFHGYFSPHKTKLYLQLERLLAHATTRIIALADVQRQELLDLRVGTPERVLAIPLGLDLAPFLDAERSAGRLRRELGLPARHEGAAGTDTPLAIHTASPLIGIVGRLVPIKCHEVFFAAAEQILPQIPGAHFVVVGDGERRAELETLASRPPLLGRVHFLGWRERADLVAVYADLDILALTSDNEGLPTVLIESMAAGRAVVATDVGGVRSLVTDGETGRLVPPRAPGAFADACLDLLRHGAQRHALGSAARRAVYPRYDLATLLETMTSFYSSLGELRPPGPHSATQRPG